MKLFLQTILIFLWIGCRSKEGENYESKISGKWILADEYFITRYDDEGFEEPPPPPREHLGYNFYSKDSCETNFSFFKVIDSTKKVGGFTVTHDNVKNLGRKTIYKIENDSLKIFDRTFNRWESIYIMRLDTNNLVLNHQNSIIQKFVRVLKE